MKNGIRSVSIFLLIITALVSGCKPDNIDLFSPATSFGSSQLVSLSVDPSAPSMAPGTKLQLEAIGTFANNTTQKITQNVTWTSSDPGVATVDSTGMVSSTPASAGSVTITAESGTVAGSAVVTFSPLASITVSPSVATIAPGTTQKFTATGTLQDSATQDITQSALWQSDAGFPVSNGLAAPTATGTSDITATFSGITGTAMLTAADVTSIDITPLNARAVRGTTRQFTATATLTNLAEQNITSFATWNSFSPQIAIINSNGLAAAISAGSAVLTASLGSASGQAAITVTEPELVSITIAPAGQTIALGGTQQFTALGTFSDGTKQDITADVAWISSNTAVAAFATAGVNGLASAVGQGTTSISATFLGITSNQTTLTVTVSQAVGVVSIIVAPSNPSVPIGATLQLTATRVSSPSGAQENITTTAIWSSSDTFIASVSQGFVIALRAGTATITATSGSFSGSTILTVTPF